jgi:hypothetical protein
MADKSIGLIELSSVAAGFEVADTMLKAGLIKDAVYRMARDVKKEVAAAEVIAAGASLADETEE